MLEKNWVLIKNLERVVAVVDDPQVAFDHLKLAREEWKFYPKTGNFTWLSDDGRQTFALVAYTVNEFYPNHPKELINATND